jgi:hypothetical protein
MFLIGITPQLASIAAGASLSGEVGLGAFTLVGISMPAVWTTAALTFQTSIDDATWQELYDDAGNEVSITGAAGQFLILPKYPSYIWRGVNLLKVRSGTSGSPVNQVAAATVTLITRSEML